jgi:plasmid stabilization system protein ParE
MSARDFQLKLSPRARRDFTFILRYTGRTWGESQVFVYRDLINAALEAIRLNPNAGHGHRDLPETHRVYPVGSHAIIYRVWDDVIGVVRILHKRMSFPLHV